MSKRRPSGDGMVRKRSDGIWEGRIVAGHRRDGRPIFKSVFARSQKELIPRLNALKETYAGIELTEESGTTVGAWLYRWLEEYKAPMIRSSTVKNYKRCIDSYLIPRVGQKLLTSLSSSDVQKMYNELKRCGRVHEHPEQGHGLSAAVVRSVHMVLHEALNDAQSMGLIAVNPTVGTTVPRACHKENRVLLHQEIDALLRTVKGDALWYDFFCTEIYTGMRRGEICALRWEDFDGNAGTLHVRRTVRYEDGKEIVGDTKTEEGNRKIVLPQTICKLLSARKENAYGAWIFHKPTDPSRPLDPKAAYGKLKQILKKAGLPELRFHDLRHTFATIAASNGIDPKTLARILGHTNAAFTLDTYTHVTGEMQRNAAKVVGAMMTDLLGKELEPWQKENQAKE